MLKGGNIVKIVAIVKNIWSFIRWKNDTARVRE